MKEAEETLSVTFTYSSTTGVFTGHFPNGTSFNCIAAPDVPMPTKLRNALQGLMQKAHTQFKANAKPERGDTDEEWEEVLAKIKQYEENNGVSVYRQRGVKKPKRVTKVTNITLSDLKIKL